MNYTSIVTSKGTITLPARIRKQLGITEGNKVTITLRGDTVEVVPQGGWEALEEVGATLRAKLKKRHSTYSDIPSLREKAETAKADELRKKYFGAR